MRLDLGGPGGVLRELSRKVLGNFLQISWTFAGTFPEHFWKFSNAFGPIQMHRDAFECFRMQSDACERIQAVSEVFGFVWESLVVLELFWSFGACFD